MLVENMVITLKINQTVGIIDPAFLGFVVSPQFPPVIHKLIFLSDSIGIHILLFITISFYILEVK